jgi:hypothetical protein
MESLCHCSSYISISLSVSVSLSLSWSLCLFCLSVTLCHSVCLSVCLSLSLSLSLFLSLFSLATAIWSCSALPHPHCHDGLSDPSEISCRTSTIQSCSHVLLDQLSPPRIIILVPDFYTSHQETLNLAAKKIKDTLECLPSKHKALSSNSDTTKINK